MCGIVGYIGSKKTEEILLDGLKELEYRGYDSAGIALLEKDKIEVFKALGKLKNLKEKVNVNNEFSLGIGHTRWATHGKPTELNAHPHLGEYSYVVHNGIIENYKELKEELQEKGHKFVSQTDTEVIVHLFENYNNELDDCEKSFQKTIERLEGAFSILLISKASPENIFFFKHGSPLIVAKGNDENEVLFASSDAPLIGLANDVVYLEDGCGGVTSTKGEIRFFDESNISWGTLPSSKQFAQKDGYRFFMEKEIHEQAHVVTDTMLGRIDGTKIAFDEFDETIMHGIEEIKICACGTSYHAGLTSAYLFERLTKVRTSVEIASEFRYKEPLLNPNTLFIVISQSGETADTLEALKMAKNAGLKSIAVCNVDNSSMTRLADYSLLTRAGIEKGVASTKAFSTQTVVLWMMALYFGDLKGVISSEKLENEIDVLREVPKSLKVYDFIHEKVRRLSKRYLHGHGFFFIGRDVFFPLALEGALKLKEISYLHAEGYPAGEMKHGPIALADPELFTIALMPENLLYEKIKSNVEELSARDSTICTISPIPFELSDDYIRTNRFDHYMLEFFEMLVAVQLLSMEISVRLGNDVDMPRNLAKSVTVE